MSESLGSSQHTFIWMDQPYSSCLVRFVTRIWQVILVASVTDTFTGVSSSAQVRSDTTSKAERNLILPSCGTVLICHPTKHFCSALFGPSNSFALLPNTYWSFAKLASGAVIPRWQNNMPGNAFDINRWWFLYISYQPTSIFELKVMYFLTL